MPKVRMPDGSVIDVGVDALLADDGTSPFSPGQFTADDIERARSQEKDKLYGRLEENSRQLADLQNTIGSLTAAEQRREAQLLEEQQRLQEAARAEEEKSLDATSLIQRKEQEWGQQLDSLNKTWEQRFAEEQQARENAAAALQKEREFNDLRGYIQSAVAANEDKIAPQLRSWITGNSQEEVDAAVARAIKTTDEITAEMQQAMGGVQQPLQSGVPAVPPVQPGVRATGGPANSDPAATFQQLTAQQIAEMPMEQYAQLRGRIGIGGQGNNRGLFG